jgi:hypothetical protein
MSEYEHDAHNEIVAHPMNECFTSVFIGASLTRAQPTQLPELVGEQSLQLALKQS